MSATVVQQRVAIDAHDDSRQLPPSPLPQSPEGRNISTVGISPYSPFSPYLVTAWTERPGNVPDTDINQHMTQFFDERYYLPETKQPLTDDMLRCLREELEAMYFEEAANKIRSSDEFTSTWSRAYSMTMFSEMELHGAPIGEGRPRSRFMHYLNKHVAVYFETSSRRSYYEDRKLSRYITRLWYRMHDGRPPLQRHHFFGKAICFGDRHFGCDMPDRRPKSIFPDVRSFHERLCRSLSSRLDDLVNFNRWESVDFWPIPDTKIQTWREHGLDLGHLFRALFMVVDDQVVEDEAVDEPVLTFQNHLDVDNWDTAGEIDYCPIELRNEDVIQYRERHAERVAREFTVLLVRTGDDQHLSSPISFEPLLKTAQALNVNRTDIGDGFEGDVVRVKVDVAVRFILSLVRREEAAFPHLQKAAEALREEQEAGCKQWVERVLEHADNVGVDANGFTWAAVRRARARLNGEAFETEQVNYLCDRLSSWDI